MQVPGRKLLRAWGWGDPHPTPDALTPLPPPCKQSSCTGERVSFPQVWFGRLRSQPAVSPSSRAGPSWGAGLSTAGSVVQGGRPVSDLGPATAASTQLWASRGVEAASARVRAASLRPRRVLPLCMWDWAPRVPSAVPWFPGSVHSRDRGPHSARLLSRSRPPEGLGFPAALPTGSFLHCTHGRGAPSWPGADHTGWGDWGHDPTVLPGRSQSARAVIKVYHGPWDS